MKQPSHSPSVVTGILLSAVLAVLGGPAAPLTAPLVIP